MIWLPAISLSASHARLPKTALCLQLFPATAAVPRRSLACSRRARAAHRPGASSRARRRRAAARRRRLARERSPTDHLGYTVTVSLSIGVVPPGAVPGGLLLPPFWAGRLAPGRWRAGRGLLQALPTHRPLVRQRSHRISTGGRCELARYGVVQAMPWCAKAGGGVVMAPVLRRRSPAAASQATPPAPPLLNHPCVAKYRSR